MESRPTPEHQSIPTATYCTFSTTNPQIVSHYHTTACTENTIPHRHTDSHSDPSQTASANHQPSSRSKQQQAANHNTHHQARITSATRNASKQHTKPPKQYNTITTTSSTPPQSLFNHQSVFYHAILIHHHTQRSHNPSQAQTHLAQSHLPTPGPNTASQLQTNRFKNTLNKYT